MKSIADTDPVKPGVRSEHVGIGVTRCGRLSVQVTNAPASRFGHPVKLFERPNPIVIDWRWSGVGNPYDVSADGQIFLIPRAVRDPERSSPASEASMLLIQNWLAEFRERK